MLFAVIFAKLVLKYYAFEKARQSLAFGRNPRLISGYMKHLQLQEASSEVGDPWAGVDVHPPPLLVMGEEDIQVEKKPHGYVCKELSRGTGLAVGRHACYIKTTTKRHMLVILIVQIVEMSVRKVRVC